MAAWLATVRMEDDNDALPCTWIEVWVLDADTFNGAVAAARFVGARRTKQDPEVSLEDILEMKQIACGGMFNRHGEPV